MILEDVSDGRTWPCLVPPPLSWVLTSTLPLEGWAADETAGPSDSSERRLEEFCMEFWTDLGAASSDHPGESLWSPKLIKGPAGAARD